MKQFRVSRVYFESEASVCYDSTLSVHPHNCSSMCVAVKSSCTCIFILIIQIITNQYPNTDLVEKLVVFTFTVVGPLHCF